MGRALRAGSRGRRSTARAPATARRRGPRAAQTTPRHPVPAASEARGRDELGVGVRVARQHGHRQDPGGRLAGRRLAACDRRRPSPPRNPPPRPAASPRPRPRARSCTTRPSDPILGAAAADRRRDVVQLQVQEHPEALVQERVDRERALGGEELQTDLDDREPRAAGGSASSTASSRLATSSASTRRSRADPRASSVVMALGLASSLGVGGPDELADRSDPVAGAPGGELRLHPDGGPRDRPGSPSRPGRRPPRRAASAPHRARRSRRRPRRCRQSGKAARQS